MSSGAKARDGLTDTILALPPNKAISVKFDTHEEAVYKRRILYTRFSPKNRNVLNDLNNRSLHTSVDNCTLYIWLTEPIFS